MGKVLHASASGYFPWCLKNGPPVGGIYSNNVAMSLTQAMKAAWVVRQYTASAPATTVVIDDPVGEITVDFLQYSETQPSQRTSVLGPAITSEEQIVCGANYSMFFTGITTLLSVDGGEPGESVEPIQIFRLWDYYTDDLVSFAGRIYNNDVYLNALWTFGQGVISLDYSSGALTIGNFEWIIVPGVSISTPIYWIFGSNSVISGFLNIIIQPSLYWSYGGTWNTSTGN